MTRDPACELSDCMAVQSFCVATLQDKLGHALPVPAELMEGTQAAGPEQLAASLDRLHRWLNLLDLAISPPMMREALRDASEKAAAEALLRHYVFKPQHIPGDQDKTDLIVNGQCGAVAQLQSALDPGRGGFVSRGL